MKGLRDLTNVPSGIVALDGARVITTGGQHFCTSYCHKNRGGPSIPCCDPDRLRDLKCGDSLMVRCQGGFSMIVAPVCLENRPVAFFFGGPLICSGNGCMDIPGLKEEGLSSDGMVPIISRERCAHLLPIISIFTGMLSMCITHSFQFFREMEERKRAENRQNHSEGLYRVIFEHSGTGMAIVRSEGSIVRANIEFGNLLKIDPGVLCGIPWTLFVSSEERKKIMETCEKRDGDLLVSMNGHEIVLTNVNGGQVSVSCIPGRSRGATAMCSRSST